MIRILCNAVQTKYFIIFTLISSNVMTTNVKFWWRPNNYLFQVIAKVSVNVHKYHYFTYLMISPCNISCQYSWVTRRSLQYCQQHYMFLAGVEVLSSTADSLASPHLHPWIETSPWMPYLNSCLITSLTTRHALNCIKSLLHAPNAYSLCTANILAYSLRSYNTTHIM